MNDRPAPNLSLRDLVIRNPGFGVHPLEWTARHLDLLHCRFQDVNTPPETKTPVHREDFVQKVKDLLEVYCWRPQLFVDLFGNKGSPFTYTKYVPQLFVRGSLLLLMPLSVSRSKPRFYFDRCKVRLVDCTLLVPKSWAKEETVIPTAPLVVAFLDYTNVIRAREQRFPSDNPWTLSEPIRGWNKRKLRLCTPKIWNQDPYLLSVMLALAHHQWKFFKSERYPVCFNSSIENYANPALGSSSCLPSG